MKKYLIAGSLLALMFSCKYKDQEPEKMMAVQLAPPSTQKATFSVEANAVKFPSPVVKPDEEVNADAKVVDNADATTSTVVKDTSKKIIKQGDIRFEAKNISATRKALLNDLGKLGGYADEDNQSLSSDSGRKEYNIKARIPAKNFDAFIDAVSSSASRIDYRHISVSDVTNEYIDMQTRLNNQKVLEATYISLLKKASRMKDILDIEEKINDTRTEIESEQGQLNVMSKQIAYSTLDMTFYTKAIEHETGTGAGYRLSTAFSEGWAMLQALFYAIITLWPLEILAIGILVLVRGWRRRRKVFAAQK